jgi:DNA-binding NtrC family response regulator
LQLPPLRERLEDLPRLCEDLLAEQARRTGRRGVYVTPEGLEKLARYEWPGNVRELANVLERATILAASPALGPEVLDVGARRRREARQPQRPAGEVATLDEAQRQHIRFVLAHTRGRIYGPNGAATLLGLKPSTLQSKMKKLGLARATD